MIKKKIINLIEILDEEDCAFDQSCAYGHRVENYSVYCHNENWKDAPRKCRNTWYTGGISDDEDCPGFKPNQKLKLKRKKK